MSLQRGDDGRSKSAEGEDRAARVTGSKTGSKLSATELNSEQLEPALDS
jgi:hypothetical protein